mgnify:CR=1 FL=1
MWVTISQYLYIYYTVTLVLYVVNTFLHIPLLSYMIGLMAIPMLIVSFIGAEKLFRILGVIFLLLGLGFFIYSGLPITQLPLHFTSTMLLLSFFSVLPWMVSVVRAGRFDQRINDLLKANVSNLGDLYARSTLTTYILCSFVNLSSLLVTQAVLKENLANLNKSLRNTFINETTLRGFALALIWSPMEVLVAITVDGTGVSYLTYLPLLMFISGFVLFVEIIRGKLKFKGVAYASPVEHRQSSGIVVQIMKLFFALSLFLLSVVVVGNYFKLNFMLSVVLVVLPFSFLWALSIRRFKSFLIIGWQTWKTRTNTMQNFVVLFLSLAFFSTSLNETPFLALIQQPFYLFSDSPLIVLFLIQMTFLVLSTIGVHPLATIAVLLEAIQPLFEFINPLSIGLVLITGSLATSMAGAYNVTVMLTSVYTEQNPYRIVWQNLPCGLLLGFVGVALASFFL